MAERWRTEHGWSVEIVHLSLTPDKRDGCWYRVRQHGSFITDVRTVAELEEWVPLADLKLDALNAAA
jgi:hypothetical protein